MRQLSFLKILCCLGMIFIFGKIYRHNLMVGLHYQEQRFERIVRELHKKKALLTYQLHEVKNYYAIAQWAKEERCMCESKMSQVITLTTGCGHEV